MATVTRGSSPRDEEWTALLQRRGRHRLRRRAMELSGLSSISRTMFSISASLRSTTSDYIKAVQLAGEEHSGRELHLHAAAIVVGVRPGRESRVWFVPDEERGWQPPPGLKEAIEAVPVPVIRQGPVVFTIFNEQSRTMNEETPLNHRPIPSEWHQVVADARGSLNVNEVIERAWV